MSSLVLHSDKGLSEEEANELALCAMDHLWLHFTYHAGYFKKEHPVDVPIIVRGEGHHIYTSKGEKLIDGISGLFCVNVGHGREELAKVAYDQMKTLGYFPLWSLAHPPAIRLAAKLASLAPGDLNRVFFTTGGGEAVETAWKLSKQYFKLIDQPARHKVISRQFAYHGTTAGALSITGIPMVKQPFAPLVPGAVKVPHTCMLRAMEHLRDDEDAYSIWAASRIDEAIEIEGPESVACVFLEPVQNSGGCFTPPRGYWALVRAICDKHGVLLVADETITGFGRCGEMFAVNRFGAVPDMIVCAKGMSSGYAPIGALIVHDKLFEPYKETDVFMPHGFTYGGHPVSAAVALKNIEIIEREGLVANVRANEDYFGEQLRTLLDIDIVGDVRGIGYFWGIELIRNKHDIEDLFTIDESDKLIRNFLSPTLWKNGIYCRADDRGEPVVQLAPALTVGRDTIDEIVAILRSTFIAAQDYRDKLMAEGLLEDPTLAPNHPGK